MDVYLDQIACNGCGGCAEICPEVFGFNDQEEKAFLRQETTDAACVYEAASLCPVDCIEINAE